MASKKDKLLASAQRFVLKGQLDKAIKEYQQLVALDPKEPRLRQKLAELLVRENRKEEAIVEYECIAKHYADNSHFLKAIAVYKQIQRLSPSRTDIGLTIAALNDKQGMIGNPMADYQPSQQPSQQPSPKPEASPPPVMTAENEIPLDLNSDRQFPAPGSLEPADALLETLEAPDWPGSFDDSRASEVPSNSATPPKELPTPGFNAVWEEEIELDLDGGQPAVLAETAPDVEPVPEAETAPNAETAPDIELFLDFSLDLDFDEVAPAPANSLSSLSDSSAPGESLSQETLAIDPEEEGPLALALAESPEEPEEPEGLDWLEELEEAEELGQAEDSGPAAAMPPLRGWEEIYPDPEGGAGAAIDLEELESRYDLGIGYKEMGMYDAAINEFAVAAGNPQRRVDCLALQAVCYREKGDPQKAQDLLQRGRDLEVLSAEERMCLNYEMAVLLETTGAVDEAIRLYREVNAVNPGFHDVGRRLSRLTGDEPLDIIDLEVVEGD